MKRIITVLASLVAVATLAQTPDAFEQYRRQMDSSFEKVKSSNNEQFERKRAEIDRSYAEHMRKAWEVYNSSPSVPAPKRPEPVTIPEYVPTEPTSAEKPVAVVEPAPKPVPVVTPKPEPKPEPVVTPKPEPEPKPEPTKPVVAPQTTPTPQAPQTTPQTKPAPAPAPAPKPTPAPTTPQTVPSQSIAPTCNQSVWNFVYYGTKVSIRVPKGVAKQSLFELTENKVADAWLAMGAGNYESTLEDCLAVRERLALSDWGYYVMVKDFARSYYGSNCNDGVLLQAYLLAHSGYRVRMARSGNDLSLLLNISGQVYGMSYFTLNGVRFYLPVKRSAATKMNICSVQFPGENSISLSHNCPPRLDYKATPVKRFASKKYPVATLELAVNSNLIAYYAEYPASDFAYYVRTSLSDNLKAQLYPMLKRVTDGKSQREAVSVILDFVQTSFAYKTDDQQFGREKWFFGDETFYYPYSDCDDRAILFTVLVRDVLNMDAVLLEYPEHLASAVRFDATTEGDYVTVDGKRYVVCDPTYVGAGVGISMPGVDAKRLKIIKL